MPTATKTSASVIKVARVAASYNGSPFTASDLRAEGCTPYSVTAAVKAGILKTTVKVQKTGYRGRPGRILVLTAKGKKLAA